MQAQLTQFVNASISAHQFKPPCSSYAQQNSVGASYFTDLQEEQAVIKRAFASNNFTSLRTHIPDRIHHGSILDERAMQAKERQQSNTQPQRKLQPIGTLGYFQSFPYEPSQYDLPEIYKRYEKMEEEHKRRKISSVEFQPAGFQKKMKYEDPFAFVDKSNPKPKQPYIFPSLLPEDTYNRFHENELRQRIIHEAQKLAGDFMPSMAGKSLTKVVKSQINQIVNDLECYLKQRLSKFSFFIGVNRRDEIEIIFKEEQGSNRGIFFTLNMASDDELLSKYMLRRNKQIWGKRSQQGLTFVLMPPWVKEPEQRLITTEK